MFDTRTYRIPLLCLLLLSWVGIQAQQVTLGSETLVNATTAGTQQNPAVAMDSSGNYVVAWEADGQDGDGFGIYFQIYDSAGNVLVSETKANSTTDGDQRFPDVAMSQDGNFIVTWMSYDINDRDWDIYRRLYDISGSALQSQSRVNSTTSGNQTFPKIAMAATGESAITWVDDQNDDSSSVGVYVRWINASGSNLASPAIVPDNQGGVQNYPDIGMDDSGNFTVVWQNNGLDGDASGIFAKRYDNTGNVLTSEFQVNSTTASDQQEPSIAMDPAGNFMVVWTAFGQDGDAQGIYSQLYDNSGNTVGSESLINTTTAGAQDHAEVAVDRNSGFYYVTWSSYGTDGSFYGVYQQAIQDNGNAYGSQARVNTRTTDFQQFSDVALWNEDKMVIVWQDGLRNSTATHDSDDYGIYMQRFEVKDTAAPVAICQNITAYLDGSGSVSITAADVDGGSTDNLEIVSYAINTSTFDCNDIGSNIVTLTVSDASGNTDACIAAVTVTDTSSPTALCQNLTVYLDGSGSSTITTGDVDNGSSDNCSVSSYSLDLSTFTCSNIGANTVTLTVGDASLNSSTCTSTVTVLDSVSPTALCQNLSVYLNGSGAATITSGDLDNGSSDNCSLSYAISQNSFGCADVGSNSVTLTVTDAGANTASCASTVTVIDSSGPTAVCQALTVYLDGSGSSTITTGDVDNGSSDNCSITSYSLDASTFSCANVGTNTVTLTLTDASSNSSSCTSTVTVIDSSAPTAVCQALTVYLDGSGSATITTGDIDNGSSDNCSVTGYSLDASTFSCANVGANTVTLTVSDASSNNSTCTSTVTVIDSSAPTAVCQALTVYLGSTGSTTITTGDVDNGSSDNCAVSSSSLDVSTFACANIGVNTVTLTVSDASGNNSTCTSAVTVVDSSAPTASCQALTVYLDGSGSASITTNDVDNGSSDNCSISSSSIDVSSFSCANVGTNTVTLTLADASSNSSSCTSTVTVIDSTAPTASCQALAVYLDGSGSATITTGDIDNGSSDNCSVTGYSLDASTFSCANVGANTVTLTVSDASSNNSTCTSTVTVIDSSAPTAVCQALTVYLGSTGSTTITTGDVDNGSSDNCAVSSSSLDVSTFACANIGVNTVTLTVSDASGNNSTCTSAVTVVDSSAPTASCQALTVYLDGSGSASITTNDVDNGSSDNCSISSSSLDISTFACANIGTNTVTLTVSDASSNNSTCTSTVTVIDSTAPTASCQALTVYLDGSGSATITTGDVDNGSSDNCSISGYSLDVSTFACANVGTNTVTLTVSDAGSNSSSCTSVVTVVDSTAPTASCQALTVYLDASGSATITTGDVDNGSSDNCSISSSSLDISTFACANIGTNTVTLTVNDASSNSATCTSTVTVVDSTAPTASCQALTVYLDGSGSASITTNDVDNGSSDNCSISSSSLDISTFACANIGTNTVTLTVSDASSNNSTCTSTVTVIDSTAPTASCQALTVYLDATGSASITTNDVDNGSSDNCSISSSSLDVSTFACANVGTNTVTLTVSDASSNSSTCTSVVTVVDSTAPTASCQALTVYLDASGSATITTNDVDNGSSDNCSISSSSLDVSTFVCANVGTNTVTLTVLDGSSNSSSCTSTVTVVDSTAPTASCQALTVYLDGSGSASITTNDVDNGSSDNCSISSSSLDISTFACANIGTNTVTLTVSDASSNNSTCTSTVTVVDSTAPTASCQALTVYLDATGSASITTNDVDNGSSDNCSISSSSLDVSTFACANVGTNTVTLTVSDASSNSSTCTSVVTVVDSTAPTASCQALTVYLDASGSATITTNDVDNGSSDNCSISSSSLDVSTFACANVGTNTVTLTVTDPSSNSATCTATVTVIDSILPTASCQAATVYLDASGNATLTANDIDNGSSDNCTLTSTLSTSSFSCANIGTNPVTLTVTDGSNNTASCTSVVTVVDSTAPTASCQAVTVYLDGSGAASITANDVDGGSSDNCSIDSLNVDVTNFNCNNLGANTVNLQVTDASGNVASCVSIVSVVDSTAPVANCMNDTVFLNSNGTGTLTTLDVNDGSSDNCSLDSLSLDITTFDCNSIGAQSVLLTAYDQSGNTSNCTAVITVLDTIAPTASCQGTTVYLDANGAAGLSTSAVDAGSSDNCTFTSSLDVSSFSCADVGANTVTLTVTDPSGNLDSCQAMVIVEDTLAPVVICKSDTILLNAQGQAVITPANVDDGSSDNCAIDTMTVSPNTFNNVGVFPVTLTVTDVNGNVSTCVSNIVIDTLTGIGPAVGQVIGLDFELWPNPADRRTEVRILSHLPPSTEKGMLTLTDLRGKVLQSFEVDLRSGEFRAVLPLDQLAAGSYLVNLKYGQHHMYKKLMKY